MSGEIEKKLELIDPPPPYFIDIDNGNGNVGNPDLNSSFNQQQPFQHQQQQFQPHFQQQEQELARVLALEAGPEPAPHPNSNANGNVNPIYGCCCSARTWTLVTINLNILGSVVLFGLGVYLIIADSNDPLGLLLIGGSVLSIIFFGLALYGVIKENVCLVTFWIVLLILGLILNAISLNFPAVIVGVFVLSCATTFKRQIMEKNSTYRQVLQMETA